MEADGGQFHFYPELYLDLVRAEVPMYDELQLATAAAGAGLAVASILELGVGTGETSARLLATYPDAHLVGIDDSEAMLAHARTRFPRADLRVQRLQDQLPEGRFDLVFSALAVHHLDAAGKADLFRRVAAFLRPAGRLVMADVVVPDDPADAVTPIDAAHDRPSRVDDQLAWMRAAGFRARVAWQHRDLAVLVGDAE
jgi:tRNA (cmo5U34)-methyltransferase